MQGKQIIKYLGEEKTMRISNGPTDNSPQWEDSIKKNMYLYWTVQWVILDFERWIFIIVTLCRKLTLIYLREKFASVTTSWAFRKHFLHLWVLFFNFLAEPLQHKSLLGTGWHVKGEKNKSILEQYFVFSPPSESTKGK